MALDDELLYPVTYIKYTSTLKLKGLSLKM